MSSSFDLTAPDHFTAGAIGEPGHRVFYVQAVEGSVIVSLKVEKGQLATLAQYIAELLADLPPVEDDAVPTEVDLVEPVVAEWVVGTIGVAVDEARDRMVVTFQELRADLTGEPDVPGVDELDELDDRNLAVFTITRPQALAFVRRSAQLVSAGRPPCMLCGRPIDPEGHVCIKTNGQLH